MEMKDVVIEIPENAEIISIKCYDATGSFFAESMSIVAGEEVLEEVAEELEKEAKEEEKSE